MAITWNSKIKRGTNTYQLSLEIAKSLIDISQKSLSAISPMPTMNRSLSQRAVCEPNPCRVVSLEKGDKEEHTKLGLLNWTKRAAAVQDSAEYRVEVLNTVNTQPQNSLQDPGGCFNSFSFNCHRVAVLATSCSCLIFRVREEIHILQPGKHLDGQDGGYRPNPVRWPPQPAFTALDPSWER